MRNIFRCTYVTVVCVCSAALVSVAAQNHFPSNEDLRHVRSVSQPKLSPDGRSVLIQVTESTADGAKNHLWLVDVQTNTARQLTYSPENDKRGEHAGAWMPDGRNIIFLAHRGEHTQLYELPINGGEAHPFAVKIAPLVDESKAPGAIPPASKSEDKASPSKAEPIECDVAEYSVSPDGKQIAIVVRDPQTPGEKKEQDEKADAVLVNHDPHGSRLYLLDPASGKITPTAVPPDVRGVVWTRQGDCMLAIAEGMNDVGDLEPAGTAWVVTVAAPEHPQQLKAIPATIEAATWSREGSHIDYVAQSQVDAPPGYSDLYEYTVADQSTHNLSAGFNGSIGGGPITEGDGVLEEVALGTRTTVMRFTGDRREELKFDTTTVSQLSTNEQQTAWVWLGSSSTQPPTLYYAQKPGQDAKVLKTPDLLPAAWTPVSSHVISWKSDAYTIEGLLYLPPQASAAHKVPLIVEVHGGPTGAFDDSWGAFIEFAAGHGWAVLRPNPRGSTGYGAAFAAANKNDMGGGDYRDIMAGVDAVVAQYPIDANKLALMGYSYGGEMAAFVEGRTDRFKAIISGAPVTDQESEYGTERGSYYDRWFYGGYPWEHAESAWKQSAMADVAKAKTPFMLLQGESDGTDPLGQSEEMYRALRQMGVPVELVEYPREDHGPLYEAIFGYPVPEPWHGFDGRQRIVTFLDKAFAK